MCLGYKNEISGQMIKPLKAQAQTALFKDPVRTAL
jgi:hypothetical protein